MIVLRHIVRFHSKVRVLAFRDSVGLIHETAVPSTVPATPAIASGERGRFSENGGPPPLQNGIAPVRLLVSEIETTHDPLGGTPRMGHYTGPKARINRRLGAMVFESAGAVRSAERRPDPPGMVTRRRKQSNFALALAEKQKIKYYYGLRERQLRNLFDKARRMKGNTGEQLLILCERRLDNVVRRAGFTVTRPQARQGIAHRHFQLNGRTSQTPSILVRQGDVVRVRKRPNLQGIYRELAQASTSTHCEFLSADSENLEVVVTTLPTFEDVSLPVDVGQVVAFLSR
jgi:small subunit ribosomal protein S4